MIKLSQLQTQGVKFAIRDVIIIFSKFWLAICIVCRCTYTLNYFSCFFLTLNNLIKIIKAARYFNIIYFLVGSFFQCRV